MAKLTAIVSRRRCNEEPLNSLKAKYRQSFLSLSSGIFFMENPHLKLIPVADSILLLMDYQPNMFKGVVSSDRSRIKNAVLTSAKIAKKLRVPIVFTSTYPEGNGDFLKELSGIYPEQTVIVRSMLCFDALDDKKVLSAIRSSGRKKLIISGLWTNMCFANTAIHGIREGFNVFGLIDGGGDATPEAHIYGVQRMLEAGVIAVTCMWLVSVWANGRISKAFLNFENEIRYRKPVFTKAIIENK